MEQGMYALYTDHLFKVSERYRHKVRLVTDDSKFIKDGFKKKIYPEYYADRDSLPDLFIKEVNIKKIDELFQIEKYGIYKNKKFPIRDANSDTFVYLGTDDTDLARELDFERTDKYFYEKKVPKEEVEIQEVKTPIEL